MDFLGGMSDMAESSEVKSDDYNSFSGKSLDKFDKIMGDDKLETEKLNNYPQLSREQMESKFSKLFDIGDLFDKFDTDNNQSNIESSDSNAAKRDVNNIEESDLSQKRKPNLQYEINGVVYETDDRGNTYKKNGVLLPNEGYTVNGNRYKTNEHGSIISCDSEPLYAEYGIRNTKEQKESGGKERQEEDDGGHIIAKILGGAEGRENLVPMRRTINRGDYKKMENEMAKALQEGKGVTIHIDLAYDGDSERPSRICAEYIIDGKKTVVELDNKENSIELLEGLYKKISDEDYSSLQEEFEDMKEDGVEGTITSIKVSYDEDGNPNKVTVGILDESTGKKSYKVYEAR